MTPNLWSTYIIALLQNWVSPTTVTYCLIVPHQRHYRRPYLIHVDGPVSQSYALSANINHLCCSRCSRMKVLNIYHARMATMRATTRWQRRRRHIEWLALTLHLINALRRTLTSADSWQKIARTEMRARNIPMRLRNINR